MLPKTEFAQGLYGKNPNVAFIAYAYLAGLYPVLLLHVALLPLNVWRLYQMRKLLARVRQASRGDFAIESMMPFMTKIEFEKADVLFRQGEAADKLYYLVSGSIRSPEIEATAVPGDIIGETGVFSSWKTRTASGAPEPWRRLKRTSGDCHLMTRPEGRPRSRSSNP